MGTLAHNLDCRRDAIVAEYPNMTVWWAADPDHQARQSDHNEDARGIVHAIDAMTYADIARGDAIVAWALSDTDDLEYVIFNRKIYSRSHGFAERDYDGSNPHTDHVHLSGKHGGTGDCDATGTGYDTAAEAMCPEGMDDMPYSEGQMQAFPWQYSGNGIGENDADTHRSTLSYFDELLDTSRQILKLLQEMQGGGSGSEAPHGPSAAEIADATAQRFAELLADAD